MEPPSHVCVYTRIAGKETIINVGALLLIEGTKTKTPLRNRINNTWKSFPILLSATKGEVGEGSLEEDKRLIN